MDSRHEFTHALKSLTHACNDIENDIEIDIQVLISSYFQVIEQLKLLAAVNSDDYYQLNEISRLLAVFLFNAGDYLGAANFYVCSLHWLEHIECSIEDFRRLIRNSLDLAECYIYLARKDLAQEAINFAIKAFDLIPPLEKTDKEIFIGNPNDNFEAFYNHYQAQTSNKVHLRSTKFQNSRTIIRMMREAKSIDLQLSDLVSQLSLPITLGAEKDLPNMLEAMSLKHEKTLKLNVPQLSAPSLDDDQIRRQIGEYLNLALDHRNAGNKIRQLETYEQILTLYKRMNNKTRTDEGVIQSLTQEIKKREPAPQPANFFYHPSAPAASSSSSSTPAASSNRMDMS